MNRLATEKSPYLLQHAANPVDWHPWGEEAFRKAREEDRPVFLSVGYATCHWCHVMAHESFEDEEVARLLNRGFVPVKVDREERPDVDQLYMNACQAMTRGGGWPLSVFLTPEGKPFFAGTYYPRNGRMGMIGFTDLLTRIAQLWESDRPRLLELSEEVVRALRSNAASAGTAAPLDEAVPARAYRQLADSFDAQWGGFGSAPKFPIPHNLTFLTRWHRRSGEAGARRMVEQTLRGMRAGGIFDQIGFGFHRYSTDQKWLVPHFEKMLYDQAQLALAFLDAAQAFREPGLGESAREIFAYVLRDMTSPEGAFYSAEDADSEGREGLFYVWTPGQVKDVLGPETGELVCRFYDIRPGGNFEDGLSIPHLPVEPARFAAEEKIPAAEMESLLRDARARLFTARSGRVHPLKDDKILTAWNGLMIAALARGSRALGDPQYAEAAGRAAAFIQERMTREGHRLCRRHRQGETAVAGYLDDYAFLVWGLIELYEATLEVGHLEQALAFQESLLSLFLDRSGGGFFYSGPENESLIVKSKEAFDQALPSGNSVAALNLLRLGRMTGNTKWESLAEETARAFSTSLAGYPLAHTQFLAALDFLLGPTREIVIAGRPEAAETRQMLRAVHRAYRPNSIVLFDPGGSAGERLRRSAPCWEFLAARGADEDPAAYVCEHYSCRRPIRDPAELARLLEG